MKDTGKQAHSNGGRSRMTCDKIPACPTACVTLETLLGNLVSASLQIKQSLLATSKEIAGGQHVFRKFLHKIGN